MWGDSWINMNMKMKDMPYYHYKSLKDEKEGKEGTVEDIKRHFSKFIER